MINFTILNLSRLLVARKASKLIKPSTTMAAGIKYLTQNEAIELDKELFSEYAFSVDQLMELAGLSIATAVAKSYPLGCYSKPVICCGPGNNGGDGLVCARHLKIFGYSPVVICPKPGRTQLYQNLLVQCNKFDIQLINTVPSEQLCNLGDLIIDSVFGFSYKPPNRSVDFSNLLNSINESSEKVPLVSVDIPSGWDVETGFTEMETSQQGIETNLKLPILKPNCLISLTAPKLCAQHFTGSFHYLGGRFCPDSLQRKYGLNLPPYPTTDVIVQL